MSGAITITRRTAFAGLLVLTLVNLLNYLDRYVLAAVLDAVRDELRLEDGEAGLLGTVFMVVYLLSAPILGRWGDRASRTKIMAGAVAAWSLATIGSGLAPDHATLMVMRALVGIGEAGYATVAPALIADLFRPARRARALSIFYLAIPLGVALGYIIGGAVGEAYGWRAAFFVAGLPGVAMAAVVAFLPDPPRGGLDDEPTPPPWPLREALRRVFASAAWRINTVGTTLMTFTMGGLAFWMPSYLRRTHDMSLGDASMAFGAVTIVAGLFGTLVGGALGDRAFARHAGGYFSVSGVGLALAAPLVAVLPYVGGLAPTLACAFAAEFLLFLNTGPLNAALVACVPANLRASAVAINVFFIHALGDAVSPWLIGAASDRWSLGLALTAASAPIAVGGVALILGGAWFHKSGHSLLGPAKP